MQLPKEGWAAMKHLEKFSFFVFLILLSLQTFGLEQSRDKVKRSKSSKWRSFFKLDTDEIADDEETRIQIEKIRQKYAQKGNYLLLSEEKDGFIDHESK